MCRLEFFLVLGSENRVKVKGFNGITSRSELWVDVQQVQSLPCHSFAVASLRHASILLHRIPICAGRLLALLRHCWACPVKAVSWLFTSRHCRLVSCHFMVPRRHAVSQLCSSSPYSAVALRFMLLLLAAFSVDLISGRFHVIAVLFKAFPGSSVPSPVLSGRCHAVACQLISVCTVHGHSFAGRIGSVLGCSVSVPLEAVPYQIISATVSADPFLRSSLLH